MSNEDRRANGYPAGRPQPHPNAQRPQQRPPQRPPQRGNAPQRPMNPNQGYGRPNPNGRPPKKKGGAGKVILIVFEVLVLLALGVALYFVLNTTKSGKMNLPEEDIIINAEVKEKMETVSKSSEGDEESSLSGYRNIALFGVDSTEGALTKNTRSDTIMIASINLDTGDCKLVSVYRDTFLNLSNDSYNKCNAAYAKGGPMQAINMLNMNLDLNITDFVTVGFSGLADTIDALGGVYIDVDEAEISHLNNYNLCMSEDLKRPYVPVENTGYQLLTGLQATAYCRIRYTKGDDFKRAERQREVIMAIADVAKKNPTKLGAIAESVFDEVYTSLDLSEIVELLGKVDKYEIVDQAGFPEESMRATGTIGKKGACVIPVNLYDNVIWLHKFLFDDDAYEPSSAVKSYSEAIFNECSPYF